MEKRFAREKRQDGPARGDKQAVNGTMYAFPHFMACISVRINYL
jgi:hypothetical protein